VAEALGETTELSLEDAIRITRDASISSNPTLNRLLSSLNVINKIDEMIRQADMQITVSRLLAFCFCAAIMAGLAAYTVMNSAVAMGLGIIAALFPLLHVARKRKKRLLKFNSQLPDTLDLLSRSLTVGHAFSESLHQVASEMPDPIGTEFGLTSDEISFGQDVRTAVENLYARVGHEDLLFFVVAVNVQNQTGGNLAETGAVSFMFDHVGVVEFDAKVASADAMLEAAIDAGADDVVSTETGHEVYAAQDSFANVAKTLEAKFGEPRKAGLVWKPQNTVAIDDEKGEKMFKLMELLNEHDDVQNVYANFEMSDALMAKMGA